MKFKKVFISEAKNKILAHSLTLKDKRLRKGKLLSQKDIEYLASNSISKIFVAEISKDDINENSAAEKITNHVISKGIVKTKAVNGRADFYSSISGMLNFDLKSLININYNNNDIALSTLERYSLVSKGQLIGNVKVLPYAMQKRKLDKILQSQKYKSIFSVNKVKNLKISLILSLQDLEENHEKIVSSISNRLDKFDLRISSIKKVLHNTESLSCELKKTIDKNDDLILIYGSTSISDLKDVVPSSIKKNKGKIISLGTPTDPGNLILLASKNKSLIVGVPGCAKSMSRNGFDVIIDRACHGISLNKMMVAEMSQGGLFKKIIKKSNLSETN